MWLLFGCINRCVISICSASRSTYCLYWLFLQLLEARQCASWGWGGPLEVRHHGPDVWGGRRQGVWMEPGAHQALCRAAVEIIEAIPKYKATHHRRLQNGLNSDRRPAVTYSSKAADRHFTMLQDFGLMWASHCCVGRLCFVHSCVRCFC